MPARTLAFFLLLGTGVFAQQLKTTGSFEISGILVDAANGRPLSEGYVAIAQVAGGGSLRVVITGQDGAFRFAGVNKGKYTLRAERQGYLAQAYDQHDQYSTAIATAPGLESRGLVFRLFAESTISGKITDEADEPVAAAEVRLFQKSPLGEPKPLVIRATAISDDEGNYHLGHLGPGRYFLSVEARPWYAQNIDRDPSEITAESGPSVDVAYAPTYYPGVTDAASAAAIDLGAAQRFTADFMLQPVSAVPIEITVGSPDSKENYEVRFSQQGLGGQLKEIPVLDREIAPGVVEILGIVPGRYLMNVNALNQDGSSSGNSEKEIEIDSSGGVHEHSESQNAVMSGTVKLDWESKDPIFPDDASVYLRNKKTGQVLRGPIQDGEYILETRVPPGIYDVGVSNVGGALIGSITATGAKVTGQTLQISGRSAVNANLVLARRLGRVDGTALLENKPISGVMIVLAPDDPGHNRWLFRCDQTDSDGTFTLNSVLPGKYTVVAIQDGWNIDYQSPDVLKRFMAQGTPVQVAPHGKYDIKVKVQPANTP